VIDADLGAGVIERNGLRPGEWPIQRRHIRARRTILRENMDRRSEPINTRSGTVIDARQRLYLAAREALLDIQY